MPTAVAAARLYRCEGERLVVHLAIATRNEANASDLRGQRFALSSYRRKTRKLVRLHLLGCPRVQLPVTVTLRRFSAGRLDKHDGLPNAFKSVVDEIAVWLGLPTNARGHADDSDPRVTWLYDQAPAPRKQTWVEVTFEPRKDGGP